MFQCSVTVKRNFVNRNVCEREKKGNMDRDQNVLHVVIESSQYYFVEEGIIIIIIIVVVVVTIIVIRFSHARKLKIGEVK